MIVLTFLLNIFIMIVARNPNLTPRLTTLFRTQTGLNVLCGSVLWGWALRFPVLPRWGWLGIAGSVLLHSFGVYTRFSNPVNRLLKPLTDWFCMLNWLALPFAPFTVIWMLFTPLPTLAPNFTSLLILKAIPFLCFGFATFAAFSQPLHRPTTLTHYVVSMIHRTATFAFGKSGRIQPSAFAKTKKDGTRYAGIAQLSDLGICSRNSNTVSKIFENGAQGVDVVVVTGGVVSADFAIRNNGKTVKESILNAFSTVRELGLPVFAVFSAQDESLPPHGFAALQQAFNEMNFKVLSKSAVFHSIPNGANLFIAAVGADGTPPETVGDLKKQKNCLSVLLSPDPIIASSLHCLPYHIALCGTYLGGLFNFPTLPYSPILNKLRQQQVPTQGLWSNGPARCFVSTGVGSTTLDPPFPSLRCGVKGTAPLLHVEIPEG